MSKLSTWSIGPSGPSGQGLKISRSQGLRVSGSQCLNVSNSQGVNVSRSQGHDNGCDGGDEGDGVNWGDRDEGE